MIKLVLLPPAARGGPAILEGAPADVRCDSEFAMPQRDRTPATRFFTAAYGWPVHSATARRDRYVVNSVHNSAQFLMRAVSPDGR